MTPESRARQIMQISCPTECDIISAIRAAENDALEWAKIKIIGDWNSKPMDSLQHLEYCIETIRALKEAT